MIALQLVTGQIMEHRESSMHRITMLIGNIQRIAIYRQRCLISQRYSSTRTLSVPKGTIVRITSRIKDFYLDINTRASRVGGAEYYYGKTPVTNPGQGKGIPMTASDGMFDTVDGGWEAINGTLDTSGLSEATYSIYVRGMDIGKQWSGVQSATLTVLPAMGYINGTVRDNNTKAGIPYARISTNTSETVNANSTGFYSFYVDAGSYMLTATSNPDTMRIAL